MKDNALKSCGIIDECSLSAGKLVIYRSEEPLTSQLPPFAGCSENAFATLMLTLPSENGSFEMTLAHDGENNVIDVSQLGTFSSMAGFWMHGVHHDFKFSSGSVAIALVYNVLWTKTTTKPTVTAAVDSVMNLRDCLQGWTSSLSTLDLPKFFAFRLSKQYENVQLKAVLLEGNDLKFFHLLKQACHDSGCSLHLANVERRLEGEPGQHGTYSGGDQWGIDSIHDDSTNVSIHNAEGKFLGITTHMDKFSFLNDDVYQRSRIPDEESIDGEEDEDYFSEDFQVIHKFRDSALLLVPDQLYAELQVEYMWTESRDERAKMVERGFERWRQTCSPESLAYLSDLCLRMIKKLEQQAGTSSGRYYSDHLGYSNSKAPSKADIHQIIKASLEAKVACSVKILKTAVGLLAAESISGPDNKDLNLIAQIAAYIGFSEVADPLRRTILRHRNICPMLQDLQTFVTEYQTYAENCHGNDITPVVITSPDLLMNWMNGCLLQAIKQVDFVSSSSPQDFADFVDNLAQHRWESLVGACKNDLKTLDINPSSLFKILKLSSERISSPSGHVHQEIQQVVLSNLNRKLKTGLVEASLFYNIIEWFIHANDTFLAQSIDILLAADKMYRPNGLPFSYLTSIRDLVQKVNDDAANFDGLLTRPKPTVLRQLYILSTIILASYLTFDIGKEPKRNHYLKHPILTCKVHNCMVCCTLNRFFANPNEKQFVSYKWKAGSDRIHAQNQIEAQIKDSGKCLKQWIDHSDKSRNQPMQLYLRKLDTRFDGKHDQWYNRRENFEKIVEDLFRIQKSRIQGQNCFGTLTDTLTRLDFQQAQGFIKDAFKTSLQGHRIIFPPTATMQEAKELKSKIQERGGKTVIMTKQDYHQQRLSETSDFTDIFVIDEMFGSESTFPASENLEDALSTVTKQELLILIDRHLSNAVVARLNFPGVNESAIRQTRNTLVHPVNSTSNLKRKAESISKAPLTEILKPNELLSDDLSEETDDEMYISDTEDEMEGREKTKKRAKMEHAAERGKENDISTILKSASEYANVVDLT